MTYSIQGLSPERFAPLFALDDAELAAIHARRVTATADRGFPCRISLEDAKAGEELILLHHTSHDVETPYRSAALFEAVLAACAATTRLAVAADLTGADEYVRTATVQQWAASARPPLQRRPAVFSLLAA